MKIYTKTGDDGTTSLFSGGRVPKTHARIEACGAVDELNAALGVARALRPHPAVDSHLRQIQNQLFTLGADLATPTDAQAGITVRIDQGAVEWLESVIDRVEAQLPVLKTFILPGGSPSGAQIHVARTVCRRAERRVVQLAGAEAINMHTLHYLNRLSDGLFVLARHENALAKLPDEAWENPG